MTNETWRPNRSFSYGAVLLILGIITLLMSNSFPDLPEGHPGPGLFPYIISLCLMLVGVALMIQFRKEEEVNHHSLHGQWLPIVLLMVIIIIFPWLRIYTGFLIALSLSIFGVAVLLKIKVWKAAIVGVLTTAVIFLLFSKLLQVPL